MVAPKGYVLDPTTRSIWTVCKQDSKGNYITTDWHLQMRNVKTIPNDEVDEDWRFRANVRKVDGNGSPLKNAVFGIYDSEEAAKKEDVALARLTTGADGLSQEGELKNKKDMMEEGEYKNQRSLARTLIFILLSCLVNAR